MKRLLPLLVLFVTAPAATAQWTYGNEWIDFGKQYWKFEVFNTGIYRIDSAALAQSGFPQGVDPRHFMLFGREKEVPIHVHGEADGVFNTGDYIEFQADRNNGWIDGRQYPYPAANPNPYFSLYNDTICYFLTWDEQAPVRRVFAYDNTDFDSYTPEPYLFAEGLRTYSDYYFVGKIDPGLGGQVAVTPGLMIESEGFGGQPIFDTGSNPAPQQDLLIHTPGAYTGPDAPTAHVTVGVATQSSQGGGQPDHHFQVRHGAGYASIGFDTVYAGTPAMHRSFDMPALDVGYFTALRVLGIHDLGGSIGPNYLEWLVPAYAKVRYARLPIINEGVPARMWLRGGGASSPARLSLTSFPGTPMMYAWGDTVRRIPFTAYNGAWNAIVPLDPISDSTQLYLYPQESIASITALRPVNGTGYFTDFSAMDIDSAMLIVAHSSLMNGATQYGLYRQNESENQYNTIVVDVEQLYDQFGGGIPKNAGAIRQWCRYLLNTWSTDPRALFLVGKSVNTWPAFFSNLPGIRPDANGAYARTLVPSYGFPSCDQCFTTGLNFDNRRMDIPVGRLSANTDQDVINYLDKVRATEAQAPALWQKNVLHFAGGQTEPQVEQLASYLNQYASLAEQPSMGAHTALFKRMTSGVISPLEQALADSVREYIEDEGVSLMTFFAHAYAANFDITIDEPENYDWNGKHPMVIGNSCYIGNIHLNGSESAGEQWVLEPDAGPIAFMASVDVGYISTLYSYTYEFYHSLSQLNHGASIGEHMKHAGLQTQVAWPTVAAQWSAQTFALQGDPTLTLGTHRLPDYSVQYDEVFFQPATVTADVDSFTVAVVVSNLGRAVDDAFNIELLRTNPGLGSASISYFATLDHVSYRDTAYFRVPTLGFTGGQGVNQFQVRVDLEPDQVDELDDVANNVTSTALFITSGDLVPVYPYEFAIVPDEVTILKASTGDPLAPLRNYVFQIDTTDLFNSPLLETTLMQAPGGVVSWQPSSIYAINAVQDSTVFFWRCSIDSASSGNNAYNWYERSFQYLSGKRGWGQAHYYQFKKDAYSGIVYDRPERDFDFYQGLRNMSAKVTGNVGGPNTLWKIELDPQDYGGCGPASWYVGVVDPANFEAWGTYGCADSGSPCYNQDHQFGNGNNGPACRQRVEYSFHFAMNDAAQLAGLQDMMNALPYGFHLIFFTWLHLDKDGMEANAPTLMPFLESLAGPGLDFSAIPDSVPYIFYFQKDVPGTFQGIAGDNINSVIDLSVYMPSAISQGRITAVDAGPAQQWHALYWDERPSDASDTTFIKVFGVQPGGEVELMNLPSAQDSMPTLGALVSAQQYPMLRLKGDFKDGDPVDAQPAQMKRWQLIASPVPECAIHPPLGLFNDLNGWAEGQDAAVAVAVQNISEFDMDSLLIAAWVVHGSTRTRVHYEVNQPLPAGAWVMDTVHFNTLGFGGLNALVIEANPIDTTTGAYHQLEQYHFNNIAQWQFEVERDLENPILDVTFDGTHILDGDIVSARPEILISLDDENTIRLLDSPQDTASFKVFLISPGQTVAKRIWFRDAMGNEVLQFIPAGGPQNVARIYYRPQFVTDGDYCLVVQANDLSNNISGDNDYKVCFEVINRSTITEVLNYPNPFTTSTRFVFTVTGSEPPSDMRIQILTVTGRVVREVKTHELGLLRVGRNITDYAWDGTDEFGDRLARGVYLYRVIARLNGEEIEVRETEASQYFTKGFGKMYLLR
ncbi:MAG: hypothetical protein IPL52_17230 [Flavobacteriales bacterium]|nr:hypothetical protein [Flavobacteriales bacterium]